LGRSKPAGFPAKNQLLHAPCNTTLLWLHRRLEVHPKGSVTHRFGTVFTGRKNTRKKVGHATPVLLRLVRSPSPRLALSSSGSRHRLHPPPTQGLASSSFRSSHRFTHHRRSTPSRLVSSAPCLRVSPHPSPGLAIAFTHHRRRARRHGARGHVQLVHRYDPAHTCSSNVAAPPPSNTMTPPPTLGRRCRGRRPVLLVNFPNSHRACKTHRAASDGVIFLQVCPGGAKLSG
jgi:hypothetical protein